MNFRIIAAGIAITRIVAPGHAAPDPAGIEFFEKNIRPVLSSKCYSCHSAESGKQKGGLSLDTREATLAGGDSGHAVVPRSAKESELLKRMKSHDKDEVMPPPKDGGALSPEVIAKFEQWIVMGAPDPRETGAKPVGRRIDVEEGRKFWAFQQPVATQPPANKDATWARTPVDRFIRANQEEKGLKPVADADRRTLLRRLYFDLIGLPPRPDEMDAFISDHSRNSLEKAVDRLLASPQFGERWGRHWLDVARYAESTGKERNFTFPEAWRYRDWVISAFNADKPYDRFIREQIAGDFLPHNSPQERDQFLIATGFLAMGPKGLNEKNKKQFAADLVDEQLDAATRSVLAVTVACARCHDHKFDPITQRDYYAMAGIFHSTETYYGTAGAQNRNGSQLIPLTPPDAVLAPTAPAPVIEDDTVADRLTPAQESRMLAAAEAKNPKLAARLKTMSDAERVRLFQKFMANNGKKKGKAAAYAAKAADPSRPAAMGVLESRPVNAPLLVRGEVDQPAEIVPRGFAAVFTKSSPGIPATASGRAQLADWLTNGNPLTARVMVNRVWQHLFGEGLVATEDNFGAMGEKPSHPALLDYLAVRFQTPAEEGGLGWSTKRLVREIVLSRTYGLSSAHDSYATEIDPSNRLLWRQEPRRLDAESIRDAVLAVSGQLDPVPPGGSVIHSIGNAYIGRGLRPEAFMSVPSRKRSVYLPIVRDFVPEALELFDFAEPSLVIASRETTNVPAQALFLMNSPFVRDNALAAARRVLASPLDFNQRLDMLHQLALGRPPSDAERKRAADYLLAEARGLSEGRAKESAAETSWATLCQALFASAEFRYLN